MLQQVLLVLPLSYLVQQLAVAFLVNLVYDFAEEVVIVRSVEVHPL